MNSLKKDIVIGLSLVPNLKELQGNRLILVTPIGVISGVPAEPDKSEYDDAMNKFTDKFYFSILQHITEKHDTELSENDGYLLLDEASIRMAGNQTINVGKMIVFYDQIIGVSFGTLQS